MSSKVYPNGTAAFTVAASDLLRVFSKGGCQIYTGSSDKGNWTRLATVAPDVEHVTSAFSATTNVRIEAGASEVLYQAGLAPVIDERRTLRGQGAPGILNATGALTAAMIGSGIVTSAATAVTGTVPTGTAMDTSFDLQIGDSIDWSVIKVGANNFTVAAATGHTLVGTAVVATTTSGLFRTRKTAAATYVTYRIG